MLDEWKPALKKLREGHRGERNSMSKDLARPYVPRRETRELRGTRKRPEVDTRLQRASNVILRIMGISSNGI